MVSQVALPLLAARVVVGVATEETVAEEMAATVAKAQEDRVAMTVAVVAGQEFLAVRPAGTVAKVRCGMAAARVKSLTGAPPRTTQQTRRALGTAARASWPAAY